jgi:uncharacterized protein
MTTTLPDRDVFARAWADWHRKHEARLADPHGFLAVTALHWLTGTPQRFDGVPGAWSTGPDGVEVVLDPGEELTLDGVPLAGRYSFGVVPERGGVLATYGDAVLEIAKRGGHDILRPRHPDNPLRARFRGTPAYEPDPRWVVPERGGVLATYGDTVLEIAKRGGHDILRPRHPDNPLRARFRGTPAYEPDPRWVVPGRYVPFDEPRPTTVGAAVDGLLHVYDAPGRVEFELDGQPLALTAFPGKEPGSLMVLFTDATSGVTTYAAHRSLSLGVPDPDGSVTLDFTRAANLPCAYTDLATCPLPPAENRLPVAVEAGERIPYERLEEPSRA